MLGAEGLGLLGHAQQRGCWEPLGAGLSVDCVCGQGASGLFIQVGNRHLKGDCFKWNNAAMNMGMQIALQHPAFHCFGYIPKSGIAGSYNRYIFNFLKKLHTVFHSIIAALLYILIHTFSSTVYKGSDFSTSTPTFIFFFFFNSSHPKGYKVNICIQLSSVQSLSRVRLSATP